MTAIEIQGVRNFSVIEDGYKGAIFVESNMGLVTLFITPGILAQLVERAQEFQIAAGAARMVARDRDTPGWRQST